LQGVDGVASLGNKVGVGIGGQMLDQISNSDFGDFSRQNISNFSSDFFNLTVLGIAGFSNLFGTSFGETDGEDSENVSVVGLNVVDGFNGGLPFSKHRAQSVSSDVHSVESGSGGSTFNFVNNQLDLSPGVVFGSVFEVTESSFNDSSL